MARELVNFVNFISTAAFVLFARLKSEAKNG